MLSLEHNNTLTYIMLINRFNVLILQQEDLDDDQNNMGNPSILIYTVVSKVEVLPHFRIPIYVMIKKKYKKF